MNRNSESEKFLRLFGPLLLYWVIEMAAQIIIMCILVIPNADEIVGAAELTRMMSGEELQMAVIQMGLAMMKITERYQVQILSVSALCTIPLTVTLFRKDRKAEREQNLPVNKKAPLSKYIWLLVLGAAMCVGCSCLATMTNLALASESYQETSAVFYSAGFLMQLLGLGIIQPIAEELVFRGLLFKRMREQSGFLQSALCVSIVFSLIHGNIVQMLYALGLGMFLAYAYEKYGSFRAPVVLHVTANLVSIIGTEAGLFDWLALAPERMAIAVVLCAFAGAVMFVMIQRIEEKPDVPEEPKEEKITPDMFR